MIVLRWTLLCIAGCLSLALPAAADPTHADEDTFNYRCIRKASDMVALCKGPPPSQIACLGAMQAALEESDYLQRLETTRYGAPLLYCLPKGSPIDGQRPSPCSRRTSTGLKPNLEMGFGEFFLMMMHETFPCEEAKGSTP